MTNEGIVAKTEMLIRSPISKVFEAFVDPAITWLDLERRRLVPPPEALLAALYSLPRTDDFRILSSSLKEGGG